VQHLPGGEDQSCRDCFLYELTITFADSQLVSTFNDLDMAESEVQPLVARLVQIMNDSLRE